MMSDQQEQLAPPLTEAEARGLGDDLLGELVAVAGDTEQTQRVFSEWLDMMPRATDTLLIASAALARLFNDRVSRRPDGRIEVTEEADDAA